MASLMESQGLHDSDDVELHRLQPSTASTCCSVFLASANMPIGGQLASPRACLGEGASILVDPVSEITL